MKLGAEEWTYIIYIYCLIVIKLIFLVTLIIVRFENKPSKQLETVNEITKNLFMGMLAVLMIYLFHPKRNSDVLIQGETKLMLFLFGVISLLEVPWDYPFNLIVDNTNVGVTQKQFSILLGGVIIALITVILNFVIN